MRRVAGDSALQVRRTHLDLARLAVRGEQYGASGEGFEKKGGDSLVKIAAEMRLKHGELYKLCKRVGGTKELAKELGIGHQTVNAWLHMRRCPVQGKYTKWFTKEVEEKLIDLSGTTIEVLFPSELRDATKFFNENKVHVRIAEIPNDQLTLMYKEQVARLATSDPSVDADRMEVARLTMLCLEQAGLSYREKRIIEMRFGLKGTPLTLRESGHVLKVTQERVRQIEQRALRKLNQRFRMMGIDESIIDIQLPPDFAQIDAAFNESSQLTLKERFEKAEEQR